MFKCLSLLFFLFLNLTVSHATPEEDAEQIIQSARSITKLSVEIHEAKRRCHRLVDDGSQEESRSEAKEWLSELDGALDAVLLNLPRFEKDEDDGRFEGIYNCESVQQIARKNGGLPCVLTAQSKQPRDGLEKGDTIAMRLVAQDCPLDEEHCYAKRGGIEYLALLSTLGQPLDEEKLPVTDYFPRFFGCFYGKDICQVLPSEKDSWETTSRKDLKKRYLYQEMTKADMDWCEYLDKGQLFTDSMVFEYLLGEWAGERILGITVGDCKLRNFGVKNVPSRYYEIGDKIYKLPPGYMPLRLDIDDPVSVSFVPKPFNARGFKLREEYIEQDTGKLVLSDLKAGQNLFDLFAELFPHLQVEEIPAGVETSRIFHIPQDSIAEEYELTPTLL